VKRFLFIQLPLIPKFDIKPGAMVHSPLDNIKFNRAAPFKKPPQLLLEEEILGLIDTARRFSPALFYPIFLLIHETAAKTSDIVELRWKDISFKDRTIQLIHSKELQRRKFDISQKLAEALQRIDRSHEHVFTSLEGQPLQNQILGRELKRLKLQLGIQSTWGLADLRSSHGANFLQAGGSTEDLQKIMGHLRPYVTKEIFNRYRKFMLD
jgi:integrase